MRLIAGEAQGLEDVEGFLAGLEQAPLAFDRAREIVVSRAPGRLDVMGGIADYSGSQVLELPLAEATRVALQRRADRRLVVESPITEGGARSTRFETDLRAFDAGGEAADYPSACSWFRRDARQQWAAYVAGVFLVLMREKGVSFSEGACLWIESSVPEGKGVSSSAALEVAVMQAVCGAYDVALGPHELALLCQKVENEVVGAPCGIMDQITAACGVKGRLVALLCQPAELLPAVPVPADLDLWGIDSGVRHAVSGSDYTSVRTGAFMGRRILADLDPRHDDHLANLSLEEFERDLEGRLPERMRGSDFLARYGGTADRVTQVLPDREYAIRQPTAHPVREQARVQAFTRELQRPPGVRDDRRLGECMDGSHAGYSACGLGSAATDRLVELVREEGNQAGLLGARITGGGSGGTVAILARASAAEAVRRVAARFRDETGQAPSVFHGSSPGAAACGILRVSLD